MRGLSENGKELDLTIYLASARTSEPDVVTYSVAEVPGKRANCPSFGTFVPEGDSETAALCHGGLCMGRFYQKCAVQRECKLATLRTKLNRAEHERMQLDADTLLARFALEEDKDEDDNDDEDDEDEEEDEEDGMDDETEAELLRGGFRRHTVNAPDWGNLRTQIPTSERAERPEAPKEAEPVRARPWPRQTYRETAEAMRTPPVVLVNEGCVGPSQFGRVVLPNPGSLRGLRTPFVAPGEHHAELVPTFLPDEVESTWERLGKNLAQGMIAACGWALYNYCRNVDLFK